MSITEVIDDRRSMYLDDVPEFLRRHPFVRRGHIRRIGAVDDRRNSPPPPQTRVGGTGAGVDFDLQSGDGTGIGHGQPDDLVLG